MNRGELLSVICCKGWPTRYGRPFELPKDCGWFWHFNDRNNGIWIIRCDGDFITALDVWEYNYGK